MSVASVGLRRVIRSSSVSNLDCVTASFKDNGLETSLMYADG